MFTHLQLKWYIIVATCALVFYLIYIPSSLRPAALGLRVYISGRTLVPMLQLLNVELQRPASSGLWDTRHLDLYIAPVHNPIKCHRYGIMLRNKPIQKLAKLNLYLKQTLKELITCIQWCPFEVNFVIGVWRFTSQYKTFVG